MKSFISMKLAKSLILMLLIGIVAGCAEKDLYNSDEDERKSKLPSEGSYFGFEMKGDVALNVNYGAPGFVANVEVYSENPVELDGINYVKKEGLKPIYSAFTKDGKLTAKMNIPTVVKEAYLYTERLGLPQCVKLEAGVNGFSYDATKAPQDKTRAAAGTGVLNDKLPYQLAPAGRLDNMYSLCAWNTYGDVITSGYTVSSSGLNELTLRLDAYLNENRLSHGGNNENLLRNPADINITIPKGGSTVDVSFVAARGAYYNALGYYYYKGKAPSNTEEFIALKKYIIFPHIEDYYLKCGTTTRLQFFGELGDQPASENFPEGYTIGWYLMRNGGAYPNPAYLGAYGQNPNITQIRPGEFTSTPINSRSRCAAYSDEIGENREFITIYDSASKLLILGVEDGFGSDSNPDNDYDDVMFFIKTSADMGAGNLPSIPGETPEIKPGIETIEGTLAFEDNWPSSGDYDMNDVIIEYKREITYDKDNNATKVVESFTPVQRENAAVFNNLFAYEVKNMGDVTLPAGCEIENGSSSIVITKGVKDVRNQTFTITRTFGSKISKDDVKKDFNPYVIVNGIREKSKGRSEVHLPKYAPTDLVDRSKLYTQNDAYFIDKDGKYPFAINIPILKFKPADETKKIDSEGQYPSFRTWVSSNGEQSTDWYMQDKGAE